jgi:betaine reductase
LLRTVQEHDISDLMVVLGATEPEAVGLVGQTVTTGDPAYAGPLTGVSLKLPVYHVFESEVKERIPREVYAKTLEGLETLHDVPLIVSAVEQVRLAADPMS